MIIAYNQKSKETKLDLPNVSSINTKWEQQTFLTGVIAGLELSKSKNQNQSVGVILGKDLEYLNEGAIGFEAGVKYINSDITVMKAVVEGILTAGQLLGSKLALNEFVAFGQLGQILNTLDYRTGLMMTISLTGFANISSMGVCISGISVFCPEKRSQLAQLAQLAFRGIIGGFCVSVLSSLIVAL